MNDLNQTIVQRSAKGLAFEKHLETLRAKLINPDPEVQKAYDELNAQLKEKSVTPRRVQLLEDLAVVYANDDYIGERLMPPVPVPVDLGLSLEYWLYNKANKFSYPSSAIGPQNSVNQVSQGVTKTPTSLTKQALKEFDDTWEASMRDRVVAGLINPAMNVLDGLAFNKELAIAAIVGTDSSYGTNTAAVAAADRWDAGGDPGKAVDTAKSNLWSGTGPGRWVAFCSRSVFDAMKRNEFVLDRFKTTGGRPLLATRQMLAEYLEVDEVLVGDARKNSANEGQTAVYARVWPDVFGIVRVSTAPSRNTACFGITIQQNMETRTWFEEGVGGRGGNWVQSSTAWSMPVICTDCGYLLTTPIG
jgi:hypothetical protein